jgi:hypothetical protein
MVCFDLHIVCSCIQHSIRHSIQYCMLYSFNWIQSWVRGLQLACTITQAQEFAWQCLHPGINRPTSGRRSRAIAAALGSGGRGSRRRGSSISGGRGSRFLFPILTPSDMPHPHPIRHAQACGVNSFAFVCDIVYYIVYDIAYDIVYNIVYVYDIIYYTCIQYRILYRII